MATEVTLAGLLRKAIPRPSARRTGNPKTQKMTSGSRLSSSRRAPSRCRKPDQRPVRWATAAGVGVVCAAVTDGPPGRMTQNCRAALDSGRSETRPDTYRGGSSFFPQMSAGQAYEDVFQAGLASGQMHELLALLLDRIQQRRNGQVRFADVKTDQTIVMTHGFDPRQHSPALGSCAVGVAAYLEFHHMMTAQTIDQVGRRSFGNHLAVVDDGET